MVRLSAALAAAVPLGVTLGLGLWCLVSMLPVLDRPRLIGRVAPYVQDVSAEARELVARAPADPTPLIGAIVAPVMRVSTRAVTRVLGGGDDAVVKLLRQAGRPTTVEAFRSRQVASGMVAAALGTLVAIVLARTGAAPAVAQVAVVVVATIAGIVIPEQLLARSAAARRRRIASELPTVLEFLTLALSAGEGLFDALRRVARTGNGELAVELRRAVAETTSGVALAPALTRMAEVLSLPELERLVEQLVAALDRGSPVVDVLRAQAQDSRDDARRRLLEAAGKKEVAMLVPLVFGVLPVTIAFAIFPGILVLQLGF